MTANGGFRPVHIHYHRPPDRTDVYEQELVVDAPAVQVTFQPSTPLTSPVELDGRIILEPGSPAVWFTFPGAWHDIGRFHDARGRFTGIYANVLTPCTFHPAPSDPSRPIRWDTTDLFLDVWIGSGEDRARTLDEEDLVRAEASGAVGEDRARRARAEARQLVAGWEAASWPPPVVREWTLERVLEARLSRRR